MVLTEISYLFNPKSKQTVSIVGFRRLLVFVTCYIIALAIGISISYVNIYIVEVGPYLKVHTSNMSSTMNLILLCSFYPIFEELSFRLSLKFNPKYLTASIIALTGFLLFKHNISIWSVEKTELIIKLVMLVLVSIITIGILRNSTIVDFLEKTWNRRFIIIYYSSISVFTLLHLVKFNISSEVLRFLPLLLFPYFIYGLILSYIRLKFNTLASIILHICINTTGTIIFLRP